MKENSDSDKNYMNVISTDSGDNVKNSNDIINENKSLKNGSKENSNNEFTIISITPIKTTINRILEKITNYNEDIFIFEIKGKTKYNAEKSWKIYKNYIEIKDLFKEIEKEMNKKKITNKYISDACKIVKDYNNGEIADNIKTISIYIMNFYNCDGGNKLEILNETLGISATSFIHNYIKPFEGYVLKKAEPTLLRSLVKYTFFPLENIIFKNWNKRWAVLKDDMISYLNSRTNLVGENVYWFDNETEALEKEDKELEIKYNSKTGISLKFNSRFERDLWKKEIEERVEKIIEDNANNIYSSYTYMKTNCGAKWFIDGENYFGYLLEQLKNAKESIFITD